MARKQLMTILAALLIAAWLVPGLVPAAAQDAVTVRTVYEMRLRGGPGTQFGTVAIVPPNTVLVLEARDEETAWLLGHTEDGAYRGWVAALYTAVLSGSVHWLPVSAEVLPVPESPAGGAAQPGGVSANPNYAGIEMGGFDPTSVAGIDLTKIPIIARPTSTARAIFWQGKAMGRNPQVVAKVGDCFSAHEYYLNPFGWDKYNLGEYTNLQDVINYYHDSLAVASYAASVGFLAGAVMDRTWTDPNVCDPQTESPLDCEYRIRNPSVALIMFGTQDIRLMTPRQFDIYLREVVRITLADNIVPILSTVPGNLDMWNHTILYNQIIVKIAQDNDLPLINLWLALEPLPNKGLGDDHLHLSFPITEPGDFSNEENLQTGYVMRNLVTLQSLDAGWRGAMR